MVTCSGNYTQLMSDNLCSFALGTDVCNGTVGDISIALNVFTHPAGTYIHIFTRHTTEVHNMHGFCET